MPYGQTCNILTLPRCKHIYFWKVWKGTLQKLVNKLQVKVNLWDLPGGSQWPEGLRRRPAGTDAGAGVPDTVRGVGNVWGTWCQWRFGSWWSHLQQVLLGFCSMKWVAACCILLLVAVLQFPFLPSLPSNILPRHAVGQHFSKCPLVFCWSRSRRWYLYCWRPNFCTILDVLAPLNWIEEHTLN